MGDRYYQQQCDFFGIKRSEMIYMGRYPESPEAIKLRAKMDRKMGAPTSRTSTRITKADILEGLRACTGEANLFADTLKLTLPELDELFTKVSSEAASVPEFTMPSGRTKKPYCDAIISILGLSFSPNKMTIAGLKELLIFLGGK